jgi:hypothetical protein
MMHFSSRLGALSIIASLLAGCAGLDASAPILASPDPLTVAEVANTTRTLQGEYFARYQEAARAQDVVGVPLIAAAAGATGALLFGAHPDTLAAIGLGAGTLTAYGAYFAPGSRAQIYLAGHQATSCLLANAAVFSDATFSKDIAVDARAQLELALSRLRGTQRPTGQTGRALYDDTIGAATAALALADSEIAAFDGAATSMELERERIQVRVGKSVSTRQPVDFAAIQTQIMGVVNALAAQQKALADAQKGAGEAPAGGAEGLAATTFGAPLTADPVMDVRMRIRALLDSLRSFVTASAEMKLCSAAI